MNWRYHLAAMLAVALILTSCAVAHSKGGGGGGGHSSGGHASPSAHSTPHVSEPAHVAPKPVTPHETETITPSTTPSTGWHWWGGGSHAPACTEERKARKECN